MPTKSTPTSDAPSPDPAATALPPSPTTISTTTTPAAATLPPSPTITTTAPAAPSTTTMSSPVPAATTRRARAASINANVALASRYDSIHTGPYRATYVAAYKHGFTHAISAVIVALDMMDEDETRGPWETINAAKEAVGRLEPREDVTGEAVEEDEGPE
ncbi:uncharacterized protein H6S33_004887 [Morchella sextelata]|uniref:uncharacterized protein n=1 Tax=Morchella sextelata TaxID=1174677 RepID=UPI001D0474C5|nr:uncharacterized protein H6S33_004887 [Morchella sextelata]KAH0605665.1 hypothetical protein H6S33_004887 [Morchella sextelata]